MTVLHTFLESLLNFLFNNSKKPYKISYSPVEKRCQIWTARNTVWKDSQKQKRLWNPLGVRK